MTNITTDIAGPLTPADGQQLVHIIINDPMPWYGFLWIMSIIGGLLVIPAIVIASRIARKRSRPIQTYRIILQFVILAILGIGSVNFLLCSAEALYTAALTNFGPADRAMLYVNMAQSIQRLAASIGLATIGGIALVMTNEIRKDPQQSVPAYVAQGAPSAEP